MFGVKQTNKQKTVGKYVSTALGLLHSFSHLTLIDNHVKYMPRPYL